MKQQFTKIGFHGTTKRIIQKAEEILDEFNAQGMRLTLRQLYYQFVARNWIKNNTKSYNKLGRIINDARLGGYIDWDLIVDRTRILKSLPHWDSPEMVIGSAVSAYRNDLWEAQDHRVEVWIEKDALIGVVEDVCKRNDVPFISCRGYTSQSEMYGAAKRLAEYIERGKTAVVLHLADHDPSGIQMTEDIENRLSMFLTGMLPDYDLDERHLIINRIGLTMRQVQKHKLPPNPAKESDSRTPSYVRTYGSNSWELDALPPNELIELVDQEIGYFVQGKEWHQAIGKQMQGTKLLQDVYSHWNDVERLVKEIR